MLLVISLLLLVSLLMVRPLLRAVTTRVTWRLLLYLVLRATSILSVDKLILHILKYRAILKVCLKEDRPLARVSPLR